MGRETPPPKQNQPWDPKSKKHQGAISLGREDGAGGGLREGMVHCSGPGKGTRDGLGGFLSWEGVRNVWTPFTQAVGEPGDTLPTVATTCC